MRSFLDHSRPEDSEEEGEGGAPAIQSDAPTSSTQQPQTEPAPPADNPNFVSGLLTPPPGSPERQERRKPTPDSETMSSKTEATSSRASSTRAESSSSATLVSAPASDGDALNERPKPKLKIKLIPPSASGSSKVASGRANAMASDNQKARHLGCSTVRLILFSMY